MEELIEAGMSTLRRRLLLCGWKEEYMAMGGIGRLATSLTDGLASGIRPGEQLPHGNNNPAVFIAPLLDIVVHVTW